MRVAKHLVFAAGVGAAACGAAARNRPAGSSIPEESRAPAVLASDSPKTTERPLAAFSPSDPLPSPASSAFALGGPTPTPTTMAADLEALALDPRHLPPIEKLDPRALRGVMKLIARSLGAKCLDCHQEGDFGAPTPRKKIAARMWNEFVAALEFSSDASPVFCDSCHEGRTRQLNRADKKALAAWMEANFVGKLKRKSEGPFECASCHVDMDMHFLSKWAAGPF
jgi:Cytochrome c7 and related cytochrome c